MAELGEAIAGYHRLLEHGAFRDLGWAEELQERMRREGLMQSGRLLNPVLRPAFVTREQLERLQRISSRFSCILDKIESMLLECPELLHRIQMLPAEKMLGSLPCGYSRSSVTSRMDAALHNGSLSFRGLETCKPMGLAYADRMADLFLSLPLMREFAKNGYAVSKLGGPARLPNAILKAWKQFGGTTKKPNLGIVELKPVAGSHSREAELLAATFTQSGMPSQAVDPDQLEFENGTLRAGGFEIDIVLRRLGTRDLLVRFDLNHPLLAAYRARAVCVINGFRSEMIQPRAMFELLTDDTVTRRLDSADRELLRDHVPWTRIVGQRKTTYKDLEIDLLPFIIRRREQFVLRPNDDSLEQETFRGASLNQTAWERAVQLALRTAYVVQESCALTPENFPVLRYGQVQFKETSVSVHPHIFDGQLQGASALLENWPGGIGGPIALAPVLVLD